MGEWNCVTNDTDECGVCGGSGISDGDCDCEGNVVDECGVCGGDATDQNDCADYIIEVSNSGYSPQHIEINLGQTVQWINIQGTHNVDGRIATYPENPASFYNGDASTGWIFTEVFDIIGHYDYECTPHKSFMTGSISVISIGCTDVTACNYDNNATNNDGCEYPGDPGTQWDGDCDCDGNVDLGCGCGEDAALTYCEDWDGDGFGNQEEGVEYCLDDLPTDMDLVSNCDDPMGDWNCAFPDFKDECGVCGGGITDPDDCPDYIVEVSSNVFTPDHLDIVSGESVMWINMGGLHNVDGKPL
jgi:plastocyanin